MGNRPDMKHIPKEDLERYRDYVNELSVIIEAWIPAYVKYLKSSVEIKSVPPEYKEMARRDRERLLVGLRYYGYGGAEAFREMRTDLKFFQKALE